LVNSARDSTLKNLNVLHVCRSQTNEQKEHHNKNKNANKKKTNVNKQTLGLGHYKAIQGQRRHQPFPVKVSYTGDGLARKQFSDEIASI